MTDRDYQHSRPLDIHRWSEHPEAIKFVTYVYDTFPNKETRENPRIKKKHLKVVLLDLYVAWLNDPALNIAVHMTPSAYSDGTISVKGKSRYNELNITVCTIDIVHRLYNAGLIGVKNGWLYWLWFELHLSSCKGSPSVSLRSNQNGRQIF